MEATLAVIALVIIGALFYMYKLSKPAPTKPVSNPVDFNPINEPTTDILGEVIVLSGNSQPCMAESITEEVRRKVFSVGGISKGNTLFTDDTMTEKFNGQGKWWISIGGQRYYRIGTDGLVDAVAVCN